MNRRLPGYLLPLMAAGMTLLLTWLTVNVAAGEGSVGLVTGLTIVLLLPAPLVVSVVWGVAVLTARPHRLAVVFACGWLAVCVIFIPHEAAWQMAGNVAAGLFAGAALTMRWRLDAALAAIVLALLPFWIWALVQIPVAEQFEALNEQVLTVVEENLPAGGSESERAMALEEERRRLVRATDLARRFYPYGVSVGLIGQAGIILVLTWLVGRRLGLAVPGWGLPPFSRWRLPFYLVWVLILGIGLMVTRVPGLADGGMNLALLAATFLSVQGIAVQFFVTGRILRGPGRVLYWITMGVFLSLLVLITGVLLGVLDQWADLRRLNTVPDGAGDDDSQNLE